jgi:hypothetical protein
MKIYLIRRESRSSGVENEYRYEAAFSTKEKAYNFFKKVGIKRKDCDEYIDEFEINKLDNIKGYFKVIFDGCQSCGKNCKKCWREEKKDRLVIKDFNVNIPNLDNNIFVKINKAFYNIEDNVIMDDYPLTLEVTSYENNETDALKDAIKKAKKWIADNPKFINKKTNWLNEKYRWRRLIF